MGRGGIAQVVVLWALLLLGTIAMSFAFAMRTEAQAARNSADAARAYYQARTGINRAIMLLSALPADNVARLAIAGEDGDAGYRVEVAGESGKIDVNSVSEEALKEVLRGSGFSEDEAEALGDAILDWRDEDDRPRAHGAEEPDYAALPEPVEPRNGPLRSVDELRFVKGVTDAVFRERLAPVFTVFGHSPQANVNAAPAAVLRALGLTAEQADAVLARRAETPFRSPAELSAFLAQQGAPQSVLPRLGTASSSRVYTITARGTAGAGIVRAVRAVVETGSGGKGGTRMLRWEDLVPAGEEGS